MPEHKLSDASLDIAKPPIGKRKDTDNLQS